MIQLYQKALRGGLSPEDIQETELALEEAPYFSLLHFLKAKYSRQPSDLFRAAIYAPNRYRLKQFIEGTAFIPAIEEAPQAEEEMPTNDLFSIINFDAAHSPTQEQQKLAFEVKEESETSQIDTFLHTELNIRKAKYAHKAAEIRAQLQRFVQGETIETEPPSPQLSQSQSIIEQFLANSSPMIRKANMKLDENPLMDESAEEDDEIVSETLAQLHWRQQNHEEAIHIYQKLRLLFPEKSAYFDVQIDKIKQEQ